MPKKRFRFTQYELIKQLFQFGLVGVSNTLISFVVDTLFFSVILKNARYPWLIAQLSQWHLTVADGDINICIATVIAFIISVSNSYFWNSRFVFKMGKVGGKEHIKAYFRTVACYAVTGLIISPIIKSLVLRWLGNDTLYWIAVLSSLVITIPLNFVLNKLWAFKKKKKENA